MTPELMEACEKAMHVWTADEELIRGGRAWLFILERTGWPVSARLLRLPPAIWFVELGYGVVARNRVFFSRYFYTTRAPDEGKDRDPVDD